MQRRGMLSIVVLSIVASFVMSLSGQPYQAAAQDEFPEPTVVVQEHANLAVVLVIYQNAAVEVALEHDTTTEKFRPVIDATADKLVIEATFGSTTVKAEATDTNNANASKVNVFVPKKASNEAGIDTTINPTCSPADGPGFSPEYQVSFTGLSTPATVIEACKSVGIVPETKLVIDPDFLQLYLWNHCSNPTSADGTCDKDRFVAYPTANTVTYTNTPICNEEFAFPLESDIATAEGSIVPISQKWVDTVVATDGVFLYLRTCLGSFTFSVITW